MPDIRQPLIAITDAGDDRVAEFRDIRERDLVGRKRLFIAEGRVVLARHPIGGLGLDFRKAVFVAAEGSDLDHHGRSPSIMFLSWYALSEASARTTCFSTALAERSSARPISS